MREERADKDSVRSEVEEEWVRLHREAQEELHRSLEEARARSRRALKRQAHQPLPSGISPPLFPFSSFSPFPARVCQRAQPLYSPPSASRPFRLCTQPSFQRREARA